MVSVKKQTPHSLSTWREQELVTLNVGTLLFTENPDLTPARSLAAGEGAGPTQRAVVECGHNLMGIQALRPCTPACCWAWVSEKTTS